MHAYLVTPGFEEALRAELGDTPTGRVLAPGVIVAEAAPPSALVFARQTLPDAIELEGASVSALAEATYAAVERALDAWPGAFTIHAFAPPPAPEADAPTSLPAARLSHTRARAAAGAPRPATRAATADEAILERRAALVAARLLGLLGERRRRAARRRRAPDAPGAFDETLLVVQVLALARERLLVSAAAPRALARGGTDVAPWPGGAPPVADDRTPPSRAYRKLEEAFAWMGAAPRAGETCVDLGAAPGSWTAMAARRGARVAAVDRAPLAPAVARLPGITSIVGNAFTYAPPTPVDWLLSDVVCEPARAIALVDAWLAAGHCRNLVVTIKFKGRAQYGALAALEPILARAAPAFARVKHLGHNKNEVTVMVRRS